jgi:rhamnose utilization protein RhaD (predicted bifunctional aldolase and dehydrogenase)
MITILEQIAELSREFGTPNYVLGGGGNTSAKNADSLWIKPSGTALPSMTADSFLEMDRSAIARLYDAEPPENVNERESMVGRMLAEAKRNPSDAGRPSVETPLHNAFSATFVVHVHPSFVGGLVCGRNSREVCESLFPDYLYMAYTDPGYMLSMRTREEIQKYSQQHGHEPVAIFMENHGVFVASDTAAGVREVFARIMTVLREQYAAAGLATEIEIGPAPSEDVVATAVEHVRRACGEDHASYVERSGPFRVAQGPLTPDHVVYMKSYAFEREPTEQSVKAFQDEYGFAPRIVSTGNGVVSFGTTENNARLAMELAKDGALVVQLAEAFGGARTMTREQWKFIDNWEVESYRRKVAAG